MYQEGEKVNLSELLSFTPKQREADRMSRQFKYFLFGGAKGGAKSYWLRWQCINRLVRWAKEGHTNVRAMLACEDYPTLKDRQVTKIDKEFPSWLGEMGGSMIEGMSFRLRPEFGGGIIALRSLDDPNKFNSSEFALIAVDELTQNPFSTFEQLRSCLRTPEIDDVSFIAGTNPGNKGHKWVKQYFVDKCFPSEETEPEKFGFLRSLPTDNPYNSPTYLKQLESITDPKIRKAYLYGDWDIFEGQAFAEWDRDIHVMKPTPLPIQWTRKITVDYGWTAPSAVYFIAVSPENRRFYYKEIYRIGLTPYQLGEAIGEACSEEEKKVLMRSGIFTGDPSMWTSNAGEKPIARMIYEGMKSKGLDFSDKQMIKAPHDRITKVSKFREGLSAFKNYDGSTIANMVWFENCTNAIRTIPEMQFDKRNPEDVDTTGEDHAFDSIAYELMTSDMPVINVRDMVKVNENIPQLISVGDNW